PSFPSRFYRVVYLPQPSTPSLSGLGRDTGGAFRLHLENGPATGVIIQASTNLLNWVPVFTNLAGVPVDFLDSAAPLYSRRFYRASVLDPMVTLVNQTANASLLRVDGAAQPFTVQVSTDLTHWSALYTNQALGKVSAAASAAKGSAGALSSFVSASRNQFL